jgi:predicted MFS family arabinose efflux permease
MKTENMRRHALFLLGFLTLLNILNFLDRLLVTSLGAQVERELGIGHTLMGVLSGPSFVILYTLAGILLATAADRWNRPKVIAVGLVVWSAAMALSGLARGFGHIAAARVMLGVGQAALTPAALSILSDVFRPQRRALASGIYYAGMPLGIGLSLQYSAWLEPLVGWRGCFHLAAAVGLILALATLFLRDPARGATDRPERDAGRGTWEILAELFGALRASPALILTILGAAAIVFAGAAGNLRMIWLQTERGFDIEIGKKAGIIYMTAGIAGAVLGGWLGDLCHKRWAAGRLLFVGWAQLALTPLAIMFYLVPADSPFFTPAWCGAILATTIFYGPVYATVQDLAPRRIRSTAVAFLIFSVNLLGVALGPTLAGHIGDLHSLTRGLVVASCVSFLAVPLFLLAARRHQRDSDKAVQEA